MCHSEWRKVIGMWWHLANYALTQHSYNLHVHVSLPRSFLRPAHRDTTRAFPSPSLESHRGRHPRIDPRTCRRRAAALGLPHQAPTPRDPRPPSPTALAPPGTLQRLAHHRLDRLYSARPGLAQIVGGRARRSTTDGERPGDSIASP